MRFKTIITLCLLLAGKLGAEQAVLGTAGVAAPWMKIPASARSLGLGEASGAYGGEASNLLANPATLGTLSGQQASLLHNLWLQGMSVDNFSYGLALEGEAALGISLAYLSFGAIDGYSINTATDRMERAGTIHPSAMSGEVALGKWLGQGLSLGLGVRFLSQSLGGFNSSSGFGGDVGLQFESQLSGLGLGLSFQNLGAEFDGAGLPANMKAGIQVVGDLFGRQLNLAGDFNLPFAGANALALSFGAELWPYPQLALRTGYKNQPSASLGGYLSAGLGVRLGSTQLNYAFLTFGDAGNTHVFELVTNFMEKNPVKTGGFGIEE